MGKLPMTKQWKAVIGLITGGADPAEVAAETAIAAEQSLSQAGDNGVLRHAFWLLTQIPLAARSDEFGERLRELGLPVRDKPDLVEVGAAMLEAIDNHSRRGKPRRDDLSEIAGKTATESLISMASRNGNSLFGTTYAADDALEALGGLSTAGQFGVLARDFFSRLIRSFLGYFLSRAIPQHVGTTQRFQSIRDHDAFDQALGHHCRETSLIVEKFASEWFSKTNFEGGITPDKAGGFVHYALTKIRAELAHDAMPMPSVRVFCGGAAIRGRRSPTDLVLDVAARPGDRAHVTLKLHDLTSKMVSGLPHRMADLLEIATYIYCADQFTKRDPETMPRLGVGWRRTFLFFIGLRDPDLWNTTSVVKQLIATLEFLSDDTFQFDFTGAQRSTDGQAYLELGADGPVSGFIPDEVMLFSGGLDSFAGAVDALLRHSKNVALVSHRASPMVAGKQDVLLRALRERTGTGRLLHVTLGVTSGTLRAVEFTQRTRSFLFAAIGFVVAHLFGRGQVSFYENGIVSLNLPLADHVLGSRATRTTHPRVLKEFGTLFSRIATQDVRVVNPFFWKTKADVIRTIADLGCADLIAETFSCASVRKATKESGHHCGVCSQCLDRRFGVLAADCGQAEPENVYLVDLFRGPREPGIDAIMAESYVLAASRYAGSSEAGFLGAHAEVFRVVRYLEMPSAEAASRLHALHVRHGQAVTEVLSPEVAATTDWVRARLTLPDSSLLGMVFGAQSQVIVQRDPAEVEQSAAAQVVSRPNPTITRPISFGIAPNGDQVVFAKGPVLQGQSARLVWALLPAFKAGLTAARGEAGHGYVKAEQLAMDLGATQAVLRQRVKRLRSDLAVQFRKQTGATIEDDDVVQNAMWKGYRLNPHLSLSSMLSDGTAVSHAAE